MGGEGGVASMASVTFGALVGCLQNYSSFPLLSRNDSAQQTVSSATLQLWQSVMTLQLP